MEKFLLLDLLKNPNLLEESKTYMIFETEGFRKDLNYDQFTLVEEINVYTENNSIGIEYKYYKGNTYSEVFSKLDACWESLYLKEASIYEQHGYGDRIAYLNGLCREYGIDKTIVFPLATMLGETEDFDGLISSLEDLM